MPIDQDDVLTILRLLEASAFDTLDLRSGDLHLVVRKSAGTETAAAGSAQAPGDPGAAAGPARSAADVPPSAAAPSDAALRPAVHTGTAEADDGNSPAGCVAVRAPLLGTFYRRPSPDAPEFVAVGAEVAETDTVCLVEVMKTYTAVSAGVRGRIARVCAEDAQMVEFGQVLFLVQPH